MPAHILLAALLATPPAVTPAPKEPAVYATIPVEKEHVASDAQFSPGGKTLIAAGLFAGVVTADDKKQERKVKDEEAILGTWRLEKSDGALHPKVVEKVRFTFAEDGKLTIEGLGVADKIEEEFKLDPAAKPKSIDLTFERAPVLGVYDLSGDTLKVCCQFDVPIGEKFTRPEELKDDPKTWAMLLTFKRVKEVKKEEKKTSNSLHSLLRQAHEFATPGITARVLR